MNEERHEHLNKIMIKGFKSIKECELDLKNINVLIGANGAGKSNFISVFGLLQAALHNTPQLYAEKRGVGSLFYKGIKATDKIHLRLSYGDVVCDYEFERTDENKLILSKPFSSNAKHYFGDFQDGKWENTVPRFFHFLDTGPSSHIKQEHNLSNSQMFHWDARNLAAFLYRLREHYSPNYQKLLKAIQRIAPYFKDFILRPNEGNNEHIVLRWQEKGNEDIFNASQLSDGTLRFICLATLLLQPAELQPATIIIDEPELGLHPYAITIFAELVKKIATRKQIIIATQSAELLDHFEADDVIVVDRTENGSEFKRLDAEKLAAWLEDDYSLGELWNKNLFGGRVAR